uniref:Integrase catalytic domain-containing protein n=1 Tax=Chromera velia CCMP2878 TaxID=1169474 RepID=A0A0G4IDQ1_9ALVE|eukprot:Cvel_2331.t1-p1 / transcript=Cvel_2331.t1 / gene=Cvel_2331 / organism=Chromera_velia_CCMP2878 / gene_product=hypothetical protein / transcript_product=hypothetical protein / location=Cvel_scaffold90:25319-27745(-) / protein_length=577 / sequence_SO=supercontig / SO=protein_coding / is_pseudo=false
MQANLVYGRQDRLGERYYLTLTCGRMICTTFRWGTKKASTIRSVFQRWVESSPGFLPTEIPTDLGTEFQGDWADFLEQQDVGHANAPVGWHRSLGALEHSHREVDVILHAIVHDKGLPSERWPDFVQLAVERYNRRPGRDGISPIERHYGQPAFSPSIQAMRDLLTETTRTAPPEKSFAVPPVAAPERPPVPSIVPRPASVSDLTQGEMIVWEVPKTGKRFLGSVQAVDESTELVEVHAWGSVWKAALQSRIFAPMWRRPQGSRVRYQQQQPSAHVPDICIVSLDEIKERQVQISPAGKLSPASAVEHASAFSVRLEGKSPFKKAQASTPKSLWSLPALADLACLFVVSEEWTDLPISTASPAKLNPCSLLDGAFSTARTHIPVRARDLTSEEKELRQSAREKGLKKFEDYAVKESVLVEAVPPSACRTAILLLWRDILKRASEEERIFKSRLCANGSLHFDRRQDVPVSNTTAAQWALRLAFCIAFAFSDFDPLTGFIVGDIENAYLTASRPASEDDSPTYVRPPPDHPQFLTHLWHLQKAIYGLKDSGFIFEGHRDHALMEAGWTKSRVPGLWWK